MSGRNILVVEDEEDIAELLSFNLSREGFHATTVADGEKALRAVARKIPSLILLDLMLPGMDGLEVCRILKRDQKTAGVPIVMVTAKGDEADIVAGLALGADDYVTKPFSMKVLVARIQAVLRRKDSPLPKSGDSVSMHGITVHPGRHEVLVRGKRVEMTLSELRILHLLASRPGWVLTRDQIVNEVHGADYPVTERSVDVQIVGLRKKLGAVADVIETIRGVGYRFKE